MDELLRCLQELGAYRIRVDVGSVTGVVGREGKNSPWVMDVWKKDNKDDAQLSVEVSVWHGATATITDAMLGVDPGTGMPAENPVLAVVAFAKEGAIAQAYATAMKIGGIDFSRSLLRDLEEMEAMLVYRDKTGKVGWYASQGLVVDVIKEKLIVHIKGEQDGR